MSRSKRFSAPVSAMLPFILLAANLRPALTSVGPLVTDIQATTGMSGTSVGLLASLPLFAFSVFAPLSRFARRLGVERTLVAALLLLVVGIIVRSAGSTGALFTGTVMLAAGIAVGNVLAPGIIKRDYPGRVGVLTTVYAVVLTLSAATASGLAVPLASALPAGWQGSLAVWAAPALIASLAWAPRAFSRKDAGEAGPGAGATTSVWRSPVAWSVTGFMGLQSLAFYVAVSWFPTVFQDNGHDPAEAGLLITVFQLVSLLATAALPLLIGQRRDQSAIAVVASLGIAAGFAGLIVVPDWVYLWIVVTGLGSGACFPLALAFISLRAADHREAASLSLMVQSIGYLLAALGPILVGVAHDIAGSWTLPLTGLVALALLQGRAGYHAGRDRTVGGPGQENVGQQGPPGRRAIEQ